MGDNGGGEIHGSRFEPCGVRFLPKCRQIQQLVFKTAQICTLLGFVRHERPRKAGVCRVGLEFGFPAIQLGLWIWF